MVSKTEGVGAARCLVDAGYGERTQEVYEACWKFGYVPTMGKDNITEMLFRDTRINPFEGTRRQKDQASIVLLLFKTDIFKTQLMSRVLGEAKQSWWVYDGIELEYAQQVTSEQRIMGEWREKGQNHLWDCEVLQLLGATRFGLNRFRGFEAVPENGKAA